MIQQDGLPSQVKGITFPNDTSRTLTFRMYSDDQNTSADIVYTIGAEAPNVTFADGSRALRLANVSVPTVGTAVSTTVSFSKTKGPLFQIPVTARASEVGGGSSFAVLWVVSVVQTGGSGIKAAMGAGSFSAGLKAVVDAVSAPSDEIDDAEAGPDPLDRSELERARRVLQTLQAAVDSALAGDSLALEAVSENES